MSTIKNVKCPGCGAYLEWDPSKGRMSCPYCGYEMDSAAVENTEPTQAEVEQQLEAEAKALEEMAHLAGYHCQNCGAQIVTESTTAATRCYYCHNPVVLTGKLAGNFKPDGVIPFAFDKEEAMNRFRKFLAGKKYVDRSFFSASQMEDFSGVYYPYWLADMEGDAVFSGEGTRATSVPVPEGTLVTTRHYHVDRVAHITWGTMQRKALSKQDRLLSDGIHPYDLSGLKPYTPAYLSGFLAEARDIEADVTRKDMEQEAASYAPRIMQTQKDFSSLNGKTDVKAIRTKMRYVLLPAWVLTFRKGNETYFYMMNGQTGEVCGKLPVDYGRLWRNALTAGGIVAAIVAAGGKFIW